MKTSFATIITGLCISTPLLAQESEKPKAPQGTKIAVVNVGRVFAEYWKSKQLKAELEDTLLPYKAKAKRLTNEAKEWEDALRGSGLSPSQKDRTREAIRMNRLELEEMSTIIQKDLGAKQEQNLVILWKEINEGISAVAKSQGYHLVLGFNNPPDPGIFSLQSSRHPKLRAIDLGGFVPLYIDESIDITRIVIYNFNAFRPESRKSPGK